MYLALDAGHGPGSRTAGVYDPGAMLQGYQEHKLAQELVDGLAADLKALGHKVYLPTGIYTSRDDRARAAGVDFYLSLHFNGGPGTGTEAFVNRTSATSAAKAFSTDVCARLAKVMGIPNRGLKYANFAVLSANKSDALVEVCFPADVKKYLANKHAVELAILNALLRAHGEAEVSTLPRIAKEIVMKEPVWILVHARHTKGRAIVKLAQALQCAVASRDTNLKTHADIKTRMTVVAAMDDPTKRAAIMKAAGL